MNLGVDLSTVVEDIREYIESETGIPVYSERMPSGNEEKSIVVYLDDKQPWMLRDRKIITLNLVVAYRVVLSDQSTTRYESDAQDEGFSIMKVLIDDVVESTSPPGVQLDFQSVECGYERDHKGDFSGRYIVELKFRLT